MKNKNPKAYWKVINSANKTEQPTAPLHELYDFFKHVNNPTVQEGNINQTNEHNTTEINNEDINQPITEKEIIETIKALKNNNCAGIDSILNEHMKCTSPYALISCFVCLNLCLDD